MLQRFPVESKGRRKKLQEVKLEFQTIEVSRSSFIFAFLGTLLTLCIVLCV